MSTKAAKRAGESSPSFMAISPGIEAEFDVKDSVLKAGQQMRGHMQGDLCVREYTKRVRALALRMPEVAKQELTHHYVGGLSIRIRFQVEMI